MNYDPDHFGKKGFKRPVKLARKMRTIDLRDLDQLTDRLLEQKLAERENEKIKIDLQKIGYDKLLGSGKVTKPLMVEAKCFSKLAVKKVEEAGGKGIVKS